MFGLDTTCKVDIYVYIYRHICNILINTHIYIYIYIYIYIDMYYISGAIFRYVPGTASGTLCSIISCFIIPFDCVIDNCLVLIASSTA